MRHLLLPINRPDLVDGVDGRGQSTMHTQYFLIDDGSQGQTIEHIRTVLPHIQRAILP